MVTPGSVTQRVDELLEGLALDPAGLTRAAIARSLAVKLDQSEDSTSGAVAVAGRGPRPGAVRHP